MSTLQTTGPAPHPGATGCRLAVVHVSAGHPRLHEHLCLWSWEAQLRATQRGPQAALLLRVFPTALLSPGGARHSCRGSGWCSPRDAGAWRSSSASTGLRKAPTGWCTERRTRRQVRVPQSEEMRCGAWAGWPTEPGLALSRQELLRRHLGPALCYPGSGWGCPGPLHLHCQRSLNTVPHGAQSGPSPPAPAYLAGTRW